MTIDKHKKAIHFSKAAQDYAKHAVLQKLISERLLERLEFIEIHPSIIIDAGSGIGNSAKQLAKKYRKAKIIQIDLSPGMLMHARKLSPKFFSKQHFVCSDVEKLPLKQSTELFFSSLMLQWCNDLDAVFMQIKTALKDNSLFIFSTLGPDTLKELSASWAEVDTEPHVNTFIDMHDIGDALMRAGFTNPVMETEYITMTYQDCHALMQDLKKIGANNADTKRAKGLTGKKKINKMVTAYEKYRQAGKLPATYEIIYGHAWTTSHDLPTKQSRNRDNEIFIPISSLKGRK